MLVDRSDQIETQRGWIEFVEQQIIEVKMSAESNFGQTLEPKLCILYLQEKFCRRKKLVLKFMMCFDVWGYQHTLT